MSNMWSWTISTVTLTNWLCGDSQGSMNNQGCVKCHFTVYHNLTFLVYAGHNGVFNSTFLSLSRTHTNTQHYMHTQGRYLQQGHFNDQVNEVRQQLLKEVLAARFYTRDWGSYYVRHIWQLPVDHLLALLFPTPTVPIPLSIIPFIHIWCPLYRGMALREIRYVGFYRVSAGFTKLNLRLFKRHFFLAHPSSTE